MRKGPFSLALTFLALACARPAAQPASTAVHRIVSLAPNVTEIVFAIGCGNKIVGTDSLSDAPAETKRLPKVGGVEPDIEKIIALRPDLVIASASAAHPNLQRALGAVHVPLLVIRTDRLSEIATAMTTIGLASGCNAADAVNSFNRALEDNRRYRPNAPRVLFTPWPDPLYVAGRNTFIDDLYKLTGAENAVAVDGWPQYSLESLMARPPDVVLYPQPGVSSDAIRAVLGRAHLPVTAIPVDASLFSRPGPRMTKAAAALNTICDQWERSR